MRRHAGMSMIEVIIALAILGFGMLTMAAAQLTALSFSDDSRNRSEAYYLAQQQMEAFQTMSRAGVEAIRIAAGYPNDPANPIDADPNDGRASAFNRSWTITPDTPEPGVYTISVQVAWVSSDGVPKNVVIEGFKSEL